MKNLNQIRAANSINITIKKDKEDSKTIAKKVPAMIIENGLIATAAFAIESNKSGYKSVFEDAIIPHLQHNLIAIVPNQTKDEKDNSFYIKDLDSFIKYLTLVDSAILRLITSETLQYLNYLRRFATDKEV